LTKRNDREWVALTLVPTLMLLGIVVSKTIYMPIWTYFVALGFGAVSMLPMSFVYAISGFSIKVGYFNELIYGCKLT
jgi:OPT oligopeptide transporter protein.